MIPSWTKLPCSKCGHEFMAVRAEPQPDSFATTVTCPVCEARQKGYAEGIEEGARARNWIGECFLRLQEAGWDEAPTYLPDVITRLLKRRGEDLSIIQKLHRGYHFDVQKPLSAMRAIFYHEDRGVVVERPSGKAVAWAQEGEPLNLDEDVTLSSRWYAEEEVKGLLLRLRGERETTHRLLCALVEKNGGRCPDCGSPDPDQHADGCDLEDYDWEAGGWKEKE